MDAAVNLAYLFAAVLFILGLKGMSHPRTAVRGNLLGVSGMAIAILVTLLQVWREGGHYWLIGLGLIAGCGIGATLAVRVKMTAMPQLVALFNGLGGAASVLVAFAEMLRTDTMEVHELAAGGVSGLIGAVTFWGSLIAYGKLEELKLFKQPIRIPAQQLINGALALVLLLLVIALAATSSYNVQIALFVAIALLASLLGLLLVNPIGGADMPVVIALLNSYSGLAAAATGFIINNSVLIIAGSLVGASGIILTNLMCKAMNRSLLNVMFGSMAGGAEGPSAEEVYKTVRATSPDDVALMLDGAQRVVIVPGYGMAVAQAQHAVRDLGKLLAEREVQVEYAIHPVAGRMPGHMNVLLAEADVPYEQLKEMDEINQTIAQADVAIVIGANDTVNPVARTDPQSPIAGMPIIDVDRARQVVVIKRSLSPGYAGIPNPLFALPNAVMLYGDGQEAILKIVAAMKAG